jgi:AraC-like DNA-binding protein
MTDLIIALAISQLAMLGSSFLLLQRGKLARLMSLFSFCLIAYLLAQLSVLPDSALISYVLNRLATMMPLILWLIAFYLFVDGGKVSPQVWIVMAVFILVRAIGVPLYDPVNAANNFWFIVVYVIPQLILLGFSIHCLYFAIHGYGVDLLEQRRQARLLFVIGMGILLIFVLGNGFFSFVDPFLSQFELFSIGTIPNSVFPLYIFLLTLGVNLSLFRPGVHAFNLQPVSAKGSVNNKENNNRQLKKVDATLLDGLTKAMEEDKLYQESGLSIARLAESLTMQEYQLRRLINNELDYRNFNQFLNHYRIEESCQRLDDSAQSQHSIATIALDVGYSSLSSFNKAFKEIKGITPSLYRAGELAG